MKNRYMPQITQISQTIIHHLLSNFIEQTAEAV